MRNKQAGMTLVELMIAISLMLILTLQLQIIFGGSRKLYLSADAMAQVYSNARAALDQIEKDVANAAKTDQMEFYNDQRGKPAGVGHYNKNANEENVFLKSNPFVPGRSYMHAMAFKQPDGYQPKDALKMGFAAGVKLRHDSIYFRTFTPVQGTPREALIEYRLWLGASDKDPRPRPILQRVVTTAKIDPNTGQPLYDPDGNPILEHQPPQDVCYYVQEFKVELWIRDHRKRNVGRFYSPKDAIRTSATADDPRPPGLKNLFAGGGDEVAVECIEGTDDSDPKAVISTVPTDVNYGKLHLTNGDRLARLAPGDKMYCISKTYPPNIQVDFLNRYLTVKEILTPSANETVVSFEEEASIRQYIAGQSLVGLNTLEMAYRGGWLPQALRIQMKIKDQRSQEIRTIARIFQLLRA